MEQPPTWTIVAVKNSENAAWWAHALEAFANIPESVPEFIHPLLDPNWNETEVVATRAEVRDAQAWATGIPGWKANNGGLLFKRI